MKGKREPRGTQVVPAWDDDDAPLPVVERVCRCRPPLPKMKYLDEWKCGYCGYWIGTDGK